MPLLAMATLLVVAATTLGCASTTPRSTTDRGVRERRARPSKLRGLSHEGLNGVLWAQTSAELAVLSASTFNAAKAALAQALQDKTWSAALEQTGEFADKPPAVIVDIDETMLDNSPFQAQLVLESSDYCPATWDAWVDLSRAASLPGARDFANAAAVSGVHVFYVTNRTARAESATVANLKCPEKAADGACLSFPLTDESDVLSLGELPPEGGPPWASDKTKRREYLSQSYRILLLVGDDLRDFVSTPANATPGDRVALAQKHADKWGSRWFLLPNPLYGSWERALYDPELSERGALEVKRAALRGFRDPVAGGCPKPAQP